MNRVPEIVQEDTFCCFRNTPGQTVLARIKKVQNTSFNSFSLKLVNSLLECHDIYELSTPYFENF